MEILAVAAIAAVTGATAWEDVPPQAKVGEVVGQFLPPPPGDYANVSNRAMSALQSYTESDPTVPAWAKAESPPVPPDYAAVANAAMSAASTSDVISATNSLDNSFDFELLELRREVYNDYISYEDWEAWQTGIREEIANSTPGDYANVSNRAMSALQSYTETDPTVPAWAKSSTKPSYTASEVGAASASQLSALSADFSDFSSNAAPAVAGYPRIYSFITGATNANVVVTNYHLTAEADAVRTHFDPSDPDLDFSTVPSSLRIEDSSSGTNRVVVDSRDWTVWYFFQKIGGAMADAVSAAVNTCRSWAHFTASGLENPVPDTLVVDVPNIWLLAGKTFEKHVAGSNAVWIIRSKDTALQIGDGGDGGILELTDAFGSPYIRFRKSDSYFIDPAADGIEYDSASGAWLVAYSSTTCPKGGANCVIQGSADYPGKAVLKDEDDPDCPATITWTGSANNWVMHAVPKPIGGAVPDSMFFGAVVEVQGEDYIEYLRPMAIPHLLVDRVKIAPEIPASHPAGTTVSWKVVE